MLGLAVVVVVAGVWLLQHLEPSGGQCRISERRTQGVCDLGHGGAHPGVCVYVCRGKPGCVWSILLGTQDCGCVLGVVKSTGWVGVGSFVMSVSLGTDLYRFQS